MTKMNLLSEEVLENLFPLIGNYDLIKATDNISFNSILDIGLGKGGASLYFALKNKDVTSLGWRIDSYDIDSRVIINKNIKIKEVLFENYITEKLFDAILMSHVLEHTQNVGIFLKKSYDLLKEDGWLFIMVPPYKSYVVGGHLTNGWNMAQLIYNLLISGFDVKNGHFTTYGYNICAFVRKSNQKLPDLRMDCGDLEVLKDFMPVKLEQNSYAKIESVNWFKSFKPIEFKYPNVVDEEYNCVVNLYQFCINLDKEKKYILYGYGSVGKLIYPLVRNCITGIYDNNSINVPSEKQIKFEDIDKNSNVIITPFKYNREIMNKLESIGCTIYKFM